MKDSFATQNNSIIASIVDSDSELQGDSFIHTGKNSRKNSQAKSELPGDDAKTKKVEHHNFAG